MEAVFTFNSTFCLQGHVGSHCSWRNQESHTEGCGAHKVCLNFNLNAFGDLHAHVSRSPSSQVDSPVHSVALWADEFAILGMRFTAKL